MICHQRERQRNQRGSANTDRVRNEQSTSGVLRVCVFVFDDDLVSRLGPEGDIGDGFVGRTRRGVTRHFCGSSGHGGWSGAIEERSGQLKCSGRRDETVVGRHGGPRHDEMYVHMTGL